MPVPANIWFNNPGPSHPSGMVETETGMGLVSGVTGDTALPFDPFTPFLEQDTNIRVQATEALPGSDQQSIKQTEWTYALMMNFSTALGVNCTFCHNTRSLGDWSQSTPQRVTAWHGIRMVRNLNTEYLDPLHSVFPAARLGPLGDSPKLNCATCHQGVYKPLFGVSMLQGFPELAGAAPP
jgi:photosynthetic reaction center cytochrome c subunit